MLRLVSVHGHALLVVLLEEPLLGSNTLTPCSNVRIDFFFVISFHQFAALLGVRHEEVSELEHSSVSAFFILDFVECELLHEFGRLSLSVRHVVRIITIFGERS